METAIQVRGLRKRFVDEPAEALVKVTMSVRASARAAVVGPVRCGKSALLGVLAGRVAPSQGWVTVLGQDPFRRANRLRRRVGWIPSRTAYPVGLTIGEVGALVRQLSGCGDPFRFEELCASFGLDLEARADRTNSTIHRLVNAALALQKKPAIVLADSSSDLDDPAADRRFFELLLSECEDTATVVLAARGLESVMGFVSEIYLMREGLIVDRCVPSDVVPRVVIERTMLDAVPAALPLESSAPTELFAVTHGALSNETARA